MMPLLEREDNRVDATRIILISLRLVQQGTQGEALTKFYQMPKLPLLKMKSIHIVHMNKKIEIDMGLQNNLGQNNLSFRRTCMSIILTLAKYGILVLNVLLGTIIDMMVSCFRKINCVCLCVPCVKC